MFPFLVLLSLVVAFIGFVSLSQATTGVGFIAGGILLAVYARIAQASVYHAQLTRDPAKERDEQQRHAELVAQHSQVVHKPTSRREKITVAAVTIGAALVVLGFATFSDGGFIDMYRGATRDAGPRSTTGVPSQFSIEQAEWGWRISNMTPVSWRMCLATSGTSTASIGAIASWGSIGVQRTDFSPALGASPATPTIHCPDREREN